MKKYHRIIADNTDITVLLGHTEEGDYISLTDMAKYKDNDPALVISHWMRLRNTIEYLGTWEELHNQAFKPTDFGRFMSEAGTNAFTLSPKKWIEATNAIGIYSKSGRNGGTFAHKDIAFNFGMWLSPTFQLYVVKEYQRLIKQEHNPLVEQWDIRRLLAKTNYTIHTDAIKAIIPKLSISKYRERILYASEADMLNIVLFGCTAKDWEEANPQLAAQGYNMRDTASINQLIVLSNLESFNSELLKQLIPRNERMGILHRIAKEQIQVLDTRNKEQIFRKMLHGD